MRLPVTSRRRLKDMGDYLSWGVLGVNREVPITTGPNIILAASYKYPIKILPKALFKLPVVLAVKE